MRGNWRQRVVALVLYSGWCVGSGGLEAPGGIASAHAAGADDKKAGVPVKVIVHDDQDRPIPTAVVRHPQEADRHRVNSVDGSWEASVLYLPDGSELPFLPRTKIELEISAPGYLTQVLAYDIRRRHNVIEITLPALKMDDSAVEEPTIGFGRDEPREPEAGQ